MEKFKTLSVLSN